MLSRLLKLVLTATLIATFAFAIYGGEKLGPAYAFMGAIVSGILWWLAAVVPFWWERQETIVSGLFNSCAASAAVFAGLAALQIPDIKVGLHPWDGVDAFKAPVVAASAPAVPGRPR
jgi:hypothetical protein